MEHWNWQHERELSRSKGRPGQREELCLELFQVFIWVRCFEIIAEYSAAACTRSGASFEQVITTSRGGRCIVRDASFARCFAIF